MIAVNKPMIQRVVTCFILSQSDPSKIAIFHRCATMPTFANHWAAVSGTIEVNDESPHSAAQRELDEETNLGDSLVVDEDGGLFINVPYRSPRTNQERIIRVYPFVAHYKKQREESNAETPSLELRGTEHDEYKFVTIQELEAMEKDNQLVPDLVRTFHHATFGRYQSTIPKAVRTWASDKENGASVMTANALKLVHESSNPIETAKQIAMLRPSMVPIVNVMNRIIATNNKDAVSVDSFQQELKRCVDLGQDEVQKLLNESTSKQQFTIATFSRSGTLAKILQPFQQQQTNHNFPKLRIICAQSTPGDEGELMAKDLNCDWVTDDQMKEMLSNKEIDLLLVGSDCIILDQCMINKVGTKDLCDIAKQTDTPVFCCSDRWKLWNDTFPPPLERDLFEIVPLKAVTTLLVPESREEEVF